MNNWVINTLINIILYYKNMYSSDDIIINNIKNSIKDVEKNIININAINKSYKYNIKSTLFINDVSNKIIYLKKKLNCINLYNCNNINILLKDGLIGGLYLSNCKNINICLLNGIYSYECNNCSNLFLFCNYTEKNCMLNIMLSQFVYVYYKKKIYKLDTGQLPYFNTIRL